MAYRVGVETEGRYRVRNVSYKVYGPHQMLAARSFLVGEISPHRVQRHPSHLDLFHGIVARARDFVATRFPGAEFHVLAWDPGAPEGFIEGLEARGIAVHRMSGVLPGLEEKGPTLSDSPAGGPSQRRSPRADRPLCRAGDPPRRGHAEGRFEGDTGSRSGSHPAGLKRATTAGRASRARTTAVPMNSPRFASCARSLARPPRPLGALARARGGAPGAMGPPLRRAPDRRDASEMRCRAGALRSPTTGAGPASE